MQWAEDDDWRREQVEEPLTVLCLDYCNKLLFFVFHLIHRHEDIYNTLTSIIHSYNVLDNKLERHEYRDRTTQELFKRAFQNIQKGQKALEPLPDLISRLDDRLNQIETILLNVSIFFL